MFFLDELDDMRLYRRNVLLPINEKDKRHTSAAFLLAPNKDKLDDIFNNGLLTARYYNSYYTERAVMYYINQENNIESFDAEYITEDARLFKDKNFNIHYEGYSHHVTEAKRFLKHDWFVRQFERFKVNKKKIDRIDITIGEKYDNSTKNRIYLVPNYVYPKMFKSYDTYCYFNAYMWIFYQMNPKLEDWLCMGLALKECGIASMYSRGDWPFNYNLGIICRSLDTYEREHTRMEYIDDLIRSNNGLKRLKVSIRDLLSLLSKDLQDSLSSAFSIKKNISEETITVSDHLGIVLEDKTYNTIFKKILYNDRIKNNKELKDFYDLIKEKYPDIKYCYNNLTLYGKRNLFIDLSYYNDAFIKNCTFGKIKGANIYVDLLKRLLNDSRYKEAGYEKQTIIIPVHSWVDVIGGIDDFHLINKSINPLSCIFWILTGGYHKLEDIFGDRDVLFLGKSSFMKINFSKIDNVKKPLYLRNIRIIAENKMVLDPEANIGSSAKSSARAIKMAIVDNIEKSRKIKIDDISTDDEDDIPDINIDDSDKKEQNEEDKKKKELVKAVDKASKSQNNVEDTLDSIDADEEESERIKKIISDLATNPDDGGNNISGARASRMLKLQNDFMDSDFEGKSIKDIINNTENIQEEKIEPISLDIDSVNPEWKDLKFAATLDSYKLDEDIVRIFNCFSTMSNPLVVLDISREDTSTNGNLIETYTCKYESARGERFTIKLDIPRFVDNRYMVLKGHRQNIPVQIFLMPIIKTQEDTVQIVSCYNKIFIRRFGTTSGKSNPCTDKLMKAFRKEYKHIKITNGDNTKVCSKYELPIDYIDLAGEYSYIETPHYVFMFNQDEIHKKFKVDDKNGLCVGYDKRSKEPIYFKSNPNVPIFFSFYLYTMIEASLANTNERETFIDNYNSANTAVRYTYSRAKMLESEIPVIVICGLAEGLEKVMRKANIKYQLSEKRPKYDHSSEDIIKFKDGFIKYPLDYASCLLMNGLKQCNTEDYSLTEINSRTMFLNFLDMFGGRIKADGLDNFQDCMIDPITKETLMHYKLPTDYVSVLLHANLLLSDNKYIKHGDIRASRRFRSKEQIANYTYIVLARAYGAYSSGLSQGKKVGFSAKQSAVIDALLVGNTTTAQSILNPLGEYEAYYAATPQGPSGMNSDRSYSLDKRSFDDSMLNVLSSSTGSAGNVGITRQITIDANIEGSRGYIYNDPSSDDKKEINSVKTLCMTESLSPFTSTRDDPFRLAMNFVQTSKHGMRCEKSDPLLITTGADEALPHLISNTFAYKAKGNGKIIEIDEDHMIIEYDKPVGKTPDGKDILHDYVDLSENVEHNSSSGFYVTLKLDTDLKEGKRVKAGDIVAYDKKSFSNEIGFDDNIAYNIGTLAKFAILNTDEGFEDSAIISDALSEGMASDVVLEVEKVIPKGANIYNLVKKGQYINEGDNLMILQNAYDEEDVNVLLKNLNGEEDTITDLGRVPIHSKVTGVVQDIVIERTVDISELSPTLKKIVTEYESGINKKKKVMKNYGIEDSNKIFPDTETQLPIGKLKNAADSVVIRIYLKYHDKFAIGCKLIYGAALKGVCKDIFPVGKEPYSVYRKNEKIHALLSIGSVNARMVGSILITTGINKGLIELSRKVKEMAGLPIEDNLI